MKKIAIYTDGACSGNPGPGGWAAIMKFGDHEKEISGYDPVTTNNRMELVAAIEGLKALKKPSVVELYSDSSYLINAFNNKWIFGWKKNGWRNSGGNDIKNPDLWEVLYKLNETHKITWIKVKGHSDNEYNNRCDQLAVNAYKAAVKPDMLTELKEIDEKDYVEETISSETVYEGLIFDVEKIKVKRPDEKEGTRDVVRHPGAAAIVPIDTDGGIYLVRQYRKAVEQIVLEIPAGKLDKDEDPIDCARRELEEETGIKAEEIKHLYSLYPSPALLDELIHIYIAEGLTKGSPNTDEGEFVSVEKLPVKVLVDYVLSGVIKDAKTISAILLAEKYLKGEI